MRLDLSNTSRNNYLVVYREFVMGLVTALLICGVMALVLYGAVRLYQFAEKPE